MTLGGVHEAGVARWDDEISLDDGTKIPRGDFLSWERATEVPPLPGEVLVERADGVAFRAMLVAWESEAVSLDSVRLGLLCLPYERISRILFLDRVPSPIMQARLSARMSTAGHGREDVLWLEKDQIPGIFDSVAGGTLRFESKGTLLEIPILSVYALGFPSPRAVPDLLLTTRDGFSVPVSSLERPDGDVWNAATPAGDFRFKPEDIARLEARPPHHGFLGDLKPTEVREGLPGVSEFPGAYRWPYRLNAGVHSGRALKVRGREYCRGIGVHSDSILVFSIPKGSMELCGAVALDDEAQGLGSVHFIIRGDDNVLFESGLMTGRDAARHFRLGLKGLNRLTLEVVTDPGKDEKDYTLDRAAWLDLILVGS